MSIIPNLVLMARRFRHTLIIFLGLFISTQAFSIDLKRDHHHVLFSNDLGMARFHHGNFRPHPLLHKAFSKPKKVKKVLAAALAFPFPFGIVGLHRIYLGCEPYVPVAYIASVGGGFGILPFIDFCAILSHKNPDLYVNNKKVFMWID